MCIICNMPTIQAAEAAAMFLASFRAAGDGMRDAAALMLQTAHQADEPAVKARYKAAHKHMVRLAREWNRIEQEREVVSDGAKG